MISASFFSNFLLENGENKAQKTKLSIVLQAKAQCIKIAAIGTRYTFYMFTFTMPIFDFLFFRFNKNVKKDKKNMKKETKASKMSKMNMQNS